MIHKIELSEDGQTISHSWTILADEDRAPGIGIVIPAPADLETQYWDSVAEQVRNKSISSAVIDKTVISADGMDVATINNLHNPTVVRVNENLGEFTVTDGSFEFTVDSPGEYRIACICALYLTKEFIVNAS